MQVSAFNPQSLINTLDLTTSGNALLSIGAIIIVIFILYYCLILPISCLLAPDDYESDKSHNWSRCSFSLFNPPSNGAVSDQINFCIGAPDFPLFPFFLFALVCVAFVVRHFELKSPSLRM